MPFSRHAWSAAALLLACVPPTHESSVIGPGRNCGDGVVDIDEACDDGNRLDGDACNRWCSQPGALLWSQFHALPEKTQFAYPTALVALGDGEFAWAGFDFTILNRLEPWYAVLGSNENVVAEGAPIVLDSGYLELGGTAQVLGIHEDGADLLMFATTDPGDPADPYGRVRPEFWRVRNGFTHTREPAPLEAGWNWLTDTGERGFASGENFWAFGTQVFSGDPPVRRPWAAVVPAGQDAELVPMPDGKIVDSGPYPGGRALIAWKTDETQIHIGVLSADGQLDELTTVTPDPSTRDPSRIGTAEVSAASDGSVWAAFVADGTLTVRHLDANGGLIALGRLGETNILDATPTDLVVDDQGFAIVTGNLTIADEAQPAEPTGQSWLAKFAPEGQLQWERQLLPQAHGVGSFNLAVDPLGGIAVSANEAEPAEPDNVLRPWVGYFSP